MEKIGSESTPGDGQRTGDLDTVTRRESGRSPMPLEPQSFAQAKDGRRPGRPAWRVEQQTHVERRGPAQCLVLRVGRERSFDSDDRVRKSPEGRAEDPSLVEACFAVLEPQFGQLKASGAFGTELAVPADADPQTRLLAMLGRRESAQIAPTGGA